MPLPGTDGFNNVAILCRLSVCVCSCSLRIIRTLNAPELETLQRRIYGGFMLINYYNQSDEGEKKGDVAFLWKLILIMVTFVCI